MRRMPLVRGTIFDVVSNQMDTPNHYELLCVTPQATADEIRSAYRRLIRVYHPDVATEAGEAMTQRLNEAQQQLLDPTLRANYDRTLRVFSTRPTHSYSGAGQAYSGAGQRAYSQPKYSAGNYRSSSSTSSNSTSAGAESAAPWPPTSKVREATYSAPKYYALMMAFILSSAAILVTTIIVFVVCYSGELTLFTPRFVPPIFVGIAWLVGALRKPPKMLIALMVIGAGLWPLAAAGIQPFAQLSDLWGSVLPCLTLLVVAVIVFRTVATPAAELSRIRPRQRTAAGFAH